MKKPTRHENKTTNQGRHYQLRVISVLYYRGALIMIFSKRPQRICYRAGVKYQQQSSLLARRQVLYTFNNIIACAGSDMLEQLGLGFKLVFEVVIVLACGEFNV